MIAMAWHEIARAMGAAVSLPAPAGRVIGVSTDSRTLVPGELFFAVRGPRFDGHDFVQAAVARGAAGCVVSRDVPGCDSTSILRVDDTIPALSRLAAEHRGRFRGQVVAITGSNGKTTTKKMIDHVLSARLKGRCSIKSFNNLIGLPLTLLAACAEDEYLVVEIGSNAPGEVAALGALARPDVGVVTSIGLAHLEGFGSLEGVRAEKLSLFDQVTEGGLCIAPVDAVAGSMTPRTCGRRALVSFGTGHDADIRVSHVEASSEGVSFRLNDCHDGCLPCPGVHNAVNAAAAFAVCRHLGLQPEEILEALRTFRLPAMRLTPVRTGDILVIDDSYNANPTSMAAALATLAAIHAPRRVFVAGDMLELGDQSRDLHEHLGRQIAEAGIEMVVAVGEHAGSVLRGVGSTGAAVGMIAVADAAEVCRELPGRLQPGDVVLVKGSRAVGLERLVDRLRQLHESPHGARMTQFAGDAAEGALV